MTATYFRRGLGRSVNAQLAEINGKQPLTRAKRAVAEWLGCTQATAAIALKLLHGGEWHHVGKYATACDYYDCEDERLPGAVAHILVCGGPSKFTLRREKLREKRLVNVPLPRHREEGRILRLAEYRRQTYRERKEERCNRQPND